MQIIRARNVQQAFPKAVSFLVDRGPLISLEDSRNGPVLKCIEPVTTMYERPQERVLFYEARNANPFFHFMEGLWMIGGRRDVKWISQFNKSFGQFSDDGKNFHGAYGHRWRKHFGFDQLAKIATILRNNKKDRRAVLQMWDANADLGKEGLDFPCNTQIYFDATHGYLNMTVCCRSNDVVWGAYGANAVHMSMMMEVVAGMVGIPVGSYWQVSNNWHAYLETFEPISTRIEAYDPYERGEVDTFNMVNGDPEKWMMDLDVFLSDGPIVGFSDPFFRRVVTPIYHAWMHRINNTGIERYEKSLDILYQCHAGDWKRACVEWMIRARAKELRRG